MPKLTKRTIDAIRPGLSRRVRMGQRAAGVRRPREAERGQPRSLFSIGTRTAVAGASRSAATASSPPKRPVSRRAGYWPTCRAVPILPRRGRADRAAMTVAELCGEYLDRAERGLILTRRGQSARSHQLSTPTRAGWSATSTRSREPARSRPDTRRPAAASYGT